MQSRKGQMQIGLFITILVASVIGLSVLLSTTDDLVSNAVDTNTVTNETINATNGTTVTLANANGNDIVSGSDRVFNRSNDFNLTRGSNYTIDLTTGQITFTNVNNTEFPANDSGVDYQYRSEDFVDNARTRTLLDVLPIMVAVAVFVVVVGLIFTG